MFVWPSAVPWLSLLALPIAFGNTSRHKATSIAMMPITHKSSIKVNALYVLKLMVRLAA